MSSENFLLKVVSWRKEDERLTNHQLRRSYYDGSLRNPRVIATCAVALGSDGLLIGYNYFPAHDF